MPKNEDGEFELILGNRQLLSVFFIVVILLGVFFTMGYIVGRNSGPVAGPEVAAARKPEPKPLVVDSASREQAPLPPVETPKSAPTQTAAQQPATVERPKSPEPVRETRPEPVKPERRAQAAPAQAAPNDQPLAGQMYLQLAATGKHEADVMVDVLRKKSFSAIAAEIAEKAGTYRVLVGPIPDGSVNKVRADLESLGFPGNKGIKRTF